MEQLISVGQLLSREYRVGLGSVSGWIMYFIEKTTELDQLFYWTFISLLHLAFVFVEFMRAVHESADNFVITIASQTTGTLAKL